MDKLGCTQAQADAQTNPSFSETILDFGGESVRNGYLVALNFGNPPQYAYGQQVVDLSRAYAGGYTRCANGRTITIVDIGTNNSTLDNNNPHPGPSGDNWLLGNYWETLAVDTYSDSTGHYVGDTGYPNVVFGSAIDAELQYSHPVPATDWSDGFAYTNDEPSGWPGEQWLVDFGDSQGCNSSGGCDYGWTAADIADIAWDGTSAGIQISFPFPEIYNQLGAQATQWENISRNVPGGIQLDGILTQTGACKQRPPCSGTDNSLVQAMQQVVKAGLQGTGTQIRGSDIRYEYS